MKRKISKNFTMKGKKNPNAGRKVFDGKDPKDVVAKLEYAFGIGCTVVDAIVYADIHKDSYYRYLKKHPKLRERFESLQRKPILKARKTIYNNLDNTDTAKWYLERKVRKEFAPHSTVDIGEKPVPILKNVSNNDSFKKDSES
jgi:hypothetical protein